MPCLRDAEVPQYRKHWGSGQAVVTLGGRDFYLGPYGTKGSRLEYDRRLTEWIAAGRPRVYKEPGEEFTVSELITRYLRFAKTYYRKADRSTDEYGNISSSVRILRRHYGKTSALDFGPKSFTAVRQAMIDEGLTRTTINSRMNRVKRMFRWAAEVDLVHSSVPEALGMVASLKKGRTKAREPQKVACVPDAVVQTTVNHLPQVVADMVLLQRLTGARPGEVCEMMPCDISNRKLSHGGR